MSLLKSLFHLWKPKYYQADKAIALANKFAVIARDGYRSQYNFISGVSDYDWDYVLTIAGLYVIAHDIKGMHGDLSRESEIRQLLFERVKSSKIPGGLAAIGECFRFVETDPKRLKTLSPDNPVQYFETALGYWALKTMLDRDLKNADEIGAARDIGHFYNNAMFGFWTGNHIKLP